MKHHQALGDKDRKEKIKSTAQQEALCQKLTIN